MRLFLLLSFVACSSSLAAFCWGWGKSSKEVEISYLREAEARERALVWQRACSERKRRLIKEDDRLIELAGNDRCIPSCIARLSGCFWGSSKTKR
jgi:hypothetical protein